MMRKMENFGARVGAILVLAAGAELPNDAQASSYAVSYDTISGFTLTFGGGAGGLSPFTLSVDASITSYGLDGGISLKDAPAACLNCSYSNSFAAHGSGAEYAYGDAQIVSRQVLAGIGAASSIGEISAFNSVGLAGGSNTMLATFTVTGSGTASFDFDATPYMNTAITADGVSADAHQLMYISISQGLTKVFEWAPDGALGSVFGGIESADPFSLNSAVTGNVLFNPGNGTFSAITNNLSSGTYGLKITMANYVSATGATVVPLPMTAWLLGSGLVPLLALGRRKTGRRKTSASA